MLRTPRHAKIEQMGLAPAPVDNGIPDQLLPKKQCGTCVPDAQAISEYATRPGVRVNGLLYFHDGIEIRCLQRPQRRKSVLRSDTH